MKTQRDTSFWKDTIRRVTKKSIIFFLFTYSLNVFGETQLTWPIEVVYHASPNKNLHEIKPINQYVFSSPSIKTASCFLLHWRDDWVNLIILEDKHYLFTMDLDKLYQTDIGGAIYLLPADNFDGNHGFGLGDYELVSESTTKILVKIEEESAISAMQRFGVDIYSVSSHDFAYIRKLENLKEKVSYLIKHGKKVDFTRQNDHQ